MTYLTLVGTTRQRDALRALASMARSLGVRTELILDDTEEGDHERDMGRLGGSEGSTIQVTAPTVGPWPLPDRGFTIYPPMGRLAS